MEYSYAKARLRLSKLENEIAILRRYGASCLSMDTALESAKKEQAELQKLMPDESDEDAIVMVRSWRNSEDGEKARVAEYVNKLREQLAGYIELNAAHIAEADKSKERALLLKTAFNLVTRELDRYTSTHTDWLGQARAELIAHNRIQKPVFEDKDAQGQD